jgi:hypothetical protein
MRGVAPAARPFFPPISIYGETLMRKSILTLSTALLLVAAA